MTLWVRDDGWEVVREAGREHLLPTGIIPASGYLADFTR